MKTLSVQQVKAILKHARQSSTRDWCAFLMTFRHALRSQEVRQLKLADVDMAAMTIKVNRVKGSRSGVQSLDRHRGEPLLDEVLALRSWMRERIEDGSQVLFNSQKGGMMSRMQLLRLFKQYAEAAGIAENLALWFAKTSAETQDGVVLDGVGRRLSVRYSKKTLEGANRRARGAHIYKGPVENRSGLCRSIVTMVQPSESLL
jgi:hypothetical protein